MSRAWPWLTMAAWLLAGTAAAQEIAIYRCTDAQGALTVQNQPCAKGMQQQKKLMQVPQSQPLPVMKAPTPPVVPALVAMPDDSPAAPAPAKAAEKIEKPAPPPLYACRRRDQTQYLAETLTDTEYCLPMQVVGLDGNPATGAGQACEVIRDNCEPVPDVDLCDAWRRQLGEAEDHFRFATAEHADERQREYARIRDLVAGSRCGDGAGPTQKP